MEITFITEFVEKERPSEPGICEHDYNPPERYYECPNCLDTCDSYNAEERGLGYHSIAECFEVLRERIDKLENPNE